MYIVNDVICSKLANSVESIVFLLKNIIYLKLYYNFSDNVERRRQSKNKKQVMIIITSISLATTVFFIGGLMYTRKKHSNQGKLL